MSSGRFKYAMLLASLPAHPHQLFSVSQPSVSRIQLDKRLALLDERDSEDLQRIEELLHWSQIKNASDEFIIKKSVEVVDSIRDHFLKSIIIWRLELRTLLSALRMRHAGFKPPPKHKFPGMGRWCDHIERNWDKNDFGIGHRLPWLMPAQQLLTQNKTYELEKLLLDLVWQYYAAECNQHYFDFPAVVIYVLRWDITNRWAHYHADEALKRFDELVEAELKDFVVDF